MSTSKTYTINGRSGIPATIEVFQNTPARWSIAAETRSLTRQQIINWVAKELPNWEIDDLWCEDGFWYGQLNRVRY